MTGFDQLIAGFSVALSWKGLLYCFIGCLWGTIVGVLPGLGPLAGMPFRHTDVRTHIRFVRIGLNRPLRKGVVVLPVAIPRHNLAGRQKAHNGRG